MAKRTRRAREIRYHRPDAEPPPDWPGWDNPDRGDDDDGGGAHVREPRRPLPKGPGGAAAANPE